MKISDFGLSRDVYEEDSYVKRSKVKSKWRKTLLVTYSLWCEINIISSICFPGPYTCEMDGNRVLI